MPEAYQTTRYKTFDGRDFATEAEAEAHERQNFAALLVGLTLERVNAAVTREAGTEALGNAIERAAYLISKARLAAGEYWRRPKAQGDAEAPPTAADRAADYQPQHDPEEV